ncbi:MAG TPA: hypothetical protein VFT56_11045 [Sphingomonas sp.]|nr:hypothetical protein [Sphingomonas sp.]
MSLSGDRLARAERRTERARARFKATADELRARLAPRRLLDDIAEEVRRAGEAGAERARRHPFAVAGMVALLSFLALRGKRRKRPRKETDAASESLPTERARSRRARRSR